MANKNHPKVNIWIIPKKRQWELSSIEGTRRPRPGVAAVVAGTVLSGEMWIDINYKAVRASRIELVFQGKEYTQFVYHTSQSTHVVKSKYRFACLEIPLDEGANTDGDTIIREGKILKGIYSIPFSIRLPANLPSTMTIESAKTDNFGRSNYAKIAYSLKAVIKGSGVFSDYSSKYPIQVQAIASSPQKSIPYSSNFEPQKVKNLTFCQQGEILVKIVLKDTRFQRGENPSIQLSIVNENSTRIRQIRICLRQEIRRLPCDTLVVRSDDLASILVYPTPASGGEDPCWTTTHVLPMIPFTETMDTYGGKRFHVQHFIDVVLLTKSMGHSNPTMHVPVTILPEDAVPLFFK